MRIHRGDCDFEWLFRREQLLIDHFGDGIEVGRGKGRHIERATDLTTLTLDAPFAAGCTAVVIVRSKACERSALATVEGAEFGHLDQEHESRDGTDALDTLEPLELCFHAGTASTLANSFFSSASMRFSKARRDCSMSFFTVVSSTCLECVRNIFAESTSWRRWLSNSLKAICSLQSGGSAGAVWHYRKLRSAQHR